MQPSDDDVSTVLAHYAFLQKWKRVVIISDGTLSCIDYTIRLRDRIAETFSEILYEQNISDTDPNQLDRTFLFYLIICNFQQHLSMHFMYVQNGQTAIACLLLEQEN